MYVLACGLSQLQSLASTTRSYPLGGLPRPVMLSPFPWSASFGLAGYIQYSAMLRLHSALTGSQLHEILTLKERQLQTVIKFNKSKNKTKLSGSLQPNLPIKKQDYTKLRDTPVLLFTLTAFCDSFLFFLFLLKSIFMEAFFNHLNPAVIKNTMLKMNKEEFVQCAEFIKKEALKQPNGPKRTMYVNLYNWCRSQYPEIHKKSPLF